MRFSRLVTGMFVFGICALGRVDAQQVNISSQQKVMNFAGDVTCTEYPSGAVEMQCVKDGNLISEVRRAANDPNLYPQCPPNYEFYSGAGCVRVVENASTALPRSAYVNAPIPTPASTNPTLCYWNQNGVLTPLDNQIGKVRGTGSAHGVCIVGEDQICYGMYDECLPAAPLSRYQQPQASAGAKVLGWFAFYNGPLAQANRCRSLLIGSTAGDPPAPDPCNTGGAASICLWAHPPNGTFHPAIVSCGGTPPTPTPVPTPAPNQFGRQITWAYDKGYIAGCGGGMFCPGTPTNGLLTRAQWCALQFNVYKQAHPDEPLPACRPIFTDVVCGAP